MGWRRSATAKPGLWMLLGLLAATLASTPGHAAAPLAAYGKLPALEHVRLSPDGQKLAYAVTDGENRLILIRQIEPDHILVALRVGAIKLRDLQWAGSNHLIITKSVTRKIDDVIADVGEWFVASDYNLAKKTQHDLLGHTGTGSDGDTLNVISNQPKIRTIGGKPYAFVQGQQFVDGQSRQVLFKVDLDNDDQGAPAIQAYADTRDYVIDAEGQPVAETEYDAASSHWALRVWKGHWEEVEHLQASIETPELIGLGRDGVSALVEFDNPDQSVLREFHVATGLWSAPVPAPDQLIHDNATHRVIGEGSLIGDQAVLHFYEPHDQAAWRAILTAFPGALVSFIGLTDDHHKFLVAVDSPEDGPGYALVDLNTGRAKWIGDQYAGLKPADISAVRPVSFKAKDGLNLTGYLTLPRGREANNLPLVVFPHGGPAARDEPGFDWWAQAMASRGYAVLQVNYRGSEGFGWTFQAAGFGEWGRKMQSDLSDGVLYLAHEGTIDPARVCIVGASYGGYAALAGATLDAGVYRCAAAVAGLSDLRKFVGWAKAGEGVGAERYWKRYMGPSEHLAEISPLAQIDRVKAPVLLVHGKDDTVVPFAQSQMMADALRRAGKPMEFVVLKSEDHWLSRGETRQQMLTAVMAFLEKYNPP